MKERPIIMSTEMVKAILEGKTQTRRVIKPQPEYREYGQGYFWKKGNMVYGLPNQGGFDDGLLGIWAACPYGQVGDRLWVRETFFVGNGKCLYKADYPNEESPVVNMLTIENQKPSWQPSIFMPRWASRITLEIVKVRVERLQEITREDCLAKGIAPYTFAKGILADQSPDLRWKFIELWDSLNAKHPWESNPWVWVIEFRQIPGEATM